MIDRFKSFFFREMALPADSGGGRNPAPRNCVLRPAPCSSRLRTRRPLQLERAEAHACLVRRHFGLKHDAADELISIAEDERRRRVDLWGFTNLIKTQYSIGQKLVLAEAMWGLVLADGVLAAREDYIMRKISRLVGLKTGYLAEARKRLESGAAQP